MFKRVAGTKDILPGEISDWQKIEQISRNIFSLYNYKEIRIPLIEDAALFNRCLGESTEIVQKQMFLIQNKEESYALRPEGTAGVVRAYIENNIEKTSGFVKFYYIGPMFRLERPQKGRLRQFHHIGCEVIGANGPDIDIEVLALADALLKAFSIEGYKLKINSLGCRNDKIKFSNLLREKLKANLDALCPDCKNRFENNILRVLDCKVETCKEIVGKLALGNEHLCADCKEHFDNLQQGITALGIVYEVSTHLVRGLDYYTRTVFEISHESLGAQDAIGAGGRYNNLVKDLDGQDTGAIGFAFGMERLLLALKPAASLNATEIVYLIALGQKAKEISIPILNSLRKSGISCDTDYENKSLKAAMRKANDLSSKYVVIIGENEINNNAATVKNMVSGKQKQVSFDKLIEELKP